MNDIIVWCPLPPVKTGPAFFLEEQIYELCQHANIAIAVSNQQYDKIHAHVKNKYPKNFKILSETDAISQENSTHIFHIANHPEHLYCLAAARNKMGYLVFHDLSLHHAIFHENRYQLSKYHSLLLKKAPFITEKLTTHLNLKKPIERSFYNIRFVGDIIGFSKGIIVHSEWARQLVRTLNPALPKNHVWHIPLHSNLSEQNKAVTMAKAKTYFGIDPGRFVISVPGFLSPHKQLGKIILLAHALQPFFDVKILVTSPDGVPYLSPEQRKLYEEYVVKNTTYLSNRDFEMALIASDLVSCIRYPTTGESSGVYAKAIAANSIPLILPILGMNDNPKLAVSFSLDNKELSRTVQQIRQVFIPENLQIARQKLYEEAKKRSVRKTISQLFNLIER